MTTGHAELHPRPESFRWLAFGVQVLVSGSVLLVFYYAFLTRWFPTHLFEAEGGKLALMLIAGVDLVLGPGLTLIAAGPKKSKALVRQDIMSTSLLRAIALTLGIWFCWENRPAAVIWLDGAFYTMPWSAFDDEPNARAALANFQQHGLPYISIALPNAPEERTQLFAAALARNSSLLFDAERYRPFDARQPLLQDNNRRYLMRLPSGKQQALEEHGAGITEIAQQKRLLLPIVSRYRTYHLLVDIESNTIIRHINIRPDLPIKYRR